MLYSILTQIPGNTKRRSTMRIVRTTSILLITVKCLFLLSLSLCAMIHTTTAQSSYNGGNYGDYSDDDDAAGYSPQPPSTIPNDNLYHDYAIRQEAKFGGGGDNVVAGTGGGILGGWMGNGISLGLGWMIGGYFHSGNVRKSLNTKHKQEQKNLYQQYYNDVYTLQQQNNELIVALEQYIAAASGSKSSTTTNTKPASSAYNTQQQRRTVK